MILGTAVGDSLGLPAEGLSPRTIRRLGWNNWQQRLFFGKGMVSDDTEHTLFVAQSLIACGGSVPEFQRLLSWKLRWWLAGMPAGIGFGTLRAIIKLWLGFPPSRSGVFSAGNGPAMRSAVIGALFSDDPDSIGAFVKASTELTHIDLKAFYGALAVAHGAAFGCTFGFDGAQQFDLFFTRCRSIGCDDSEWQRLVDSIEFSLSRQLSVQAFAAELGLEKRGVTGYIYHTVPVALYSWLRHYGDFGAALTAVLDCGGDTDTAGAITGALAGSVAGERGIPRQWLDDCIEWPRSVAVMCSIGDALFRVKNGETAQPVKYSAPGVVLRNALFTVVVLVHGLLRLVPCFLRKRR